MVLHIQHASRLWSLLQLTQTLLLFADNCSSRPQKLSQEHMMDLQSQNSFQKGQGSHSSGVHYMQITFLLKITLQHHLIPAVFKKLAQYLSTSLLCTRGCDENTRMKYSKCLLTAGWGGCTIPQRRVYHIRAAGRSSPLDLSWQIQMLGISNFPMHQETVFLKLWLLQSSR